MIKITQWSLVAPAHMQLVHISFKVFVIVFVFVFGEIVVQRLIVILMIMITQRSQHQHICNLHLCQKLCIFLCIWHRRDSYPKVECNIDDHDHATVTATAHICNLHLCQNLSPGLCCKLYFQPFWCNLYFMITSKNIYPSSFWNVWNKRLSGRMVLNMVKYSNLLLQPHGRTMNIFLLLTLCI